MKFSEKVKKEALERSAFRCCICKDHASEIHHITPQAKDGLDTLMNACPLCSSCHDFFGDNYNKKNKITALRNHWWNLVKLKSEVASKANKPVVFEGVQINPNHRNLLREKNVALYHIIYENENFNQAVEALFSLVKDSQTRFPFQDRVLFLDIEGHRNKNGGFDNDMYELQRYFIMRFLSRYLTEINMPLGHFRTNTLQINEVPEKYTIGKSLKDKYNEWKRN